jgi:hypothetical protein
MGFNFMYVGRDEDTLNDTLSIVKRWDRLPLEMKVPSMMGQMIAPLAQRTGLDIDDLLSNPNGVNLQSIAEALGKRMGIDVTTLTSFLTPTGKLPTIGTRPSPNVPFGGVHIPKGFDMTPRLASSGGIFNASWMIESGGISMNPIEPFMHLMLDSLDGKNITRSDVLDAAMVAINEVPALSGLMAAFTGGAGPNGFNISSVLGSLKGLGSGNPLLSGQ